MWTQYETEGEFGLHLKVKHKLSRLQGLVFGGFALPGSASLPPPRLYFRTPTWCLSQALSVEEKIKRECFCGPVMAYVNLTNRLQLSTPQTLSSVKSHSRYYYKHAIQQSWLNVCAHVPSLGMVAVSITTITFLHGQVLESAFLKKPEPEQRACLNCLTWKLRFGALIWPALGSHVQTHGCPGGLAGVQILTAFPVVSQVGRCYWS